MDRDLVVPLPDGTRLAADLYRAAGTGPGPVLVSYYPYRKDDIIGSLFERTRIRLCERGYASVFVDMAGTGASEGEYGESFDLAREGRDGAEIIEWVAGQDWCDGNVGAWGVSYGGMNALAAAAHRPAHLRAIIAVYATTDIYRDTIAPGGCPGMLGRYAWAAHMMALGLCPPTRQDPDGRWRRTWTQRLRRLAGGPSHAVNWQAHPERDAYWQGRVIDATAIDVPAMLIGGWADMFKDAMTSLFGAVTRAEEAGHGPVDARAPASVRGAALRLGKRDGGLVGRSPAAARGPARAGAGAGPVLRAGRRVAQCAAVAAGRRPLAAAVPGRASAWIRDCRPEPAIATTSATPRSAWPRACGTRSGAAMAGPRSKAAMTPGASPSPASHCPDRSWSRGVPRPSCT